VLLDEEDVLSVELVDAVAALAALVALADETALLSFVSVEARPLCCAAAWKSAPRNC
jgi:hypothetical protein